jgi:hypothetical protein
MKIFTVIPVLSVCLSLGASHGQVTGGSGFARPPAGVDEALRERVLEFYQLEQAGRFRQAEALVCEESRDRYYNMEKQRWSSVELLRTSYEDGFQKARATVALGTTMNTFSGPIPVKAPLTSLWHLENGSWCRYFPEPSRDGIMTPFGLMKTDKGSSTAPATPFGAGAPPVPTDPRQLEAMVKLSATHVRLPASGGAETVEVFNGMPGRVDLKLACPQVAGLECRLSSSAIDKDGKATLTLKFTPGQSAAPAAADVQVMVEPLGTRKSIRVEFQR